ncbi:adenylate kinase family protein [Candidatus Nanohalococcus occultus]|uniref:Putative adenylate kinase n=1 Tax=Candidatus Nanohalococcus occultus TaxID=2978047 RepID=A0ABY8CF73_9ARCH|nr:Adenylate kinase [Candidatus Nanohaloarchaeota archaeon SVXNc]
MKVTVTGTPGTGKTSVSEKLEGYEKIHLTEFVKEHGLGTDGEVFEVDTEAMCEKLEEETSEGDYLIEGHLAHYISSDICIVLRCDPDELEERLGERRYSESKVRENVESEAMDLILQQAVQNQEAVVEVDTTGRTVEETVKAIEEKISEGKSSYGKVDWTDSL